MPELHPAVLAEDLRALADGPFDHATRMLLEQAAEMLDEQAEPQPTLDPESSVAPAPDAEPAEAAAVLRGMAEHGVRISDRAFEHHTIKLLAEYDRRGAAEDNLTVMWLDTSDDLEQLRHELEHARAEVDHVRRHLAKARADRHELRRQRAAAIALADKAEHGCLRWADPLPVPEWVGRLREALGVTDARS